MRRCYICNEHKPLTEFYSTSWACKPCQRVRDAARKNREGSEQDRNTTPSARARKVKYARKHLHPVRERARRDVRSAISSGALARPEACESCGQAARRSDGRSAVHAHHDDYSKPLAVRWLCVKCHRLWHKLNDAAMSQQERA